MIYSCRNKSVLSFQTMNIFFLSLDAAMCAIMHCDKHVVKMILETTQLLWCAHHVLRPLDWEMEVPQSIKVYRKTHVNHPIAVWVRKDIRNYQWTTTLGLELCREYTRRYHKTHACEPYITWLSTNSPFQSEEKEEDNRPKKKAKVWTLANVKNLTPVPLCMDEKFYQKDENGDYDLVQSYRNYYRLGKADIAMWKYCNPPLWWSTYK